MGFFSNANIEGFDDTYLVTDKRFNEPNDIDDEKQLRWEMISFIAVNGNKTPHEIRELLSLDFETLRAKYGNAKARYKNQNSKDNINETTKDSAEDPVLKEYEFEEDSRTPRGR